MTLAANIAALPNGDDAPIYALRAYALFAESTSNDGTNPNTNTAPYALKSENISSFTITATGRIRITFTENMPTTNYLLLAGGVNTDDSSYVRDVMVRDRQLGYVDVRMVYVNAASSGNYVYESSIAIVF